MMRTLPNAPKRLTRIAGLLYLIAGIFGGFAVGYVTPMLYAPGDAATTAANVVANAGLVRIVDLLVKGVNMPTPSSPAAGVGGAPAGLGGQLL